MRVKRAESCKVSKQSISVTDPSGEASGAETVGGPEGAAGERREEAVESGGEVGVAEGERPSTSS